MHDPVNRAYDCACELLDTACGLTGELQRPGSEEALAPILGCLEETFAEVARAHEELRRRLASIDAIERLIAALAEAQDACHEARVELASAPAAQFCAPSADP